MATMNLTLKVWRQKNSQEKGRMVDYKVTNISDHNVFFGNVGCTQRTTH